MFPAGLTTGHSHGAGVNLLLATRTNGVLLAVFIKLVRKF
jgi:hypothetical protein